MSCPSPILAVGAQLKSTFALGHERPAILSHHAGDLDHYEAIRAFGRDIELYQQLFEVTPEVIIARFASGLCLDAVCGGAKCNQWDQAHRDSASSCTHGKLHG